MESYLEKWGISNFQVIIKENRGRDVSALLVTFRKVMLQYTYACFVHDKREKYEGIDAAEVKMWIRCLWDSVLSSKEYVCNVLDLLEENKEIGLLVPSELAGKDLKFSYADTWRDNFSNVLELASRMNLNCNLKKGYPAITLGTVFWCRTAALEALLSKEWEYNDFPKEPIHDDYTINHAIERILGYVAQSAGYKTGYVMSEQFAERYIMQLKDTLRNVYSDLKYMENMLSMSLEEVELWTRRKNAVISYMNKFEKTYFYGAGLIGAKCFQMILLERKPDGFIVSSREEKCKEYLMLPVYVLDEIALDENSGIVITVGKKYKHEIVEKLESFGITNYLLLP